MAAVSTEPATTSEATRRKTPSTRVTSSPRCTTPWATVLTRKSSIQPAARISSSRASRFASCSELIASRHPRRPPRTIPLVSAAGGNRFVHRLPRSRCGPLFRPQPQQIIFDVLYFERARIGRSMKLRQLPHPAETLRASAHSTRQSPFRRPSAHPGSRSSSHCPFKENFRKNFATHMSLHDEPAPASYDTPPPRNGFLEQIVPGEPSLEV